MVREEEELCGRKRGEVVLVVRKRKERVAKGRDERRKGHRQ